MGHGREGWHRPIRGSAVRAAGVMWAEEDAGAGGVSGAGSTSSLSPEGGCGMARALESEMLCGSRGSRDVGPALVEPAGAGGVICFVSSPVTSNMILKGTATASESESDSDGIAVWSFTQSDGYPSANPLAPALTMLHSPHALLMTMKTRSSTGRENWATMK